MHEGRKHFNDIRFPSHNNFMLIELMFTMHADPEDEVELIEPKRTSTVDDVEGGDGRIPIIIIRTGGDGGGFPFNPFSGGFPFGFGRGQGEPAVEVDPNQPGFFDDFPGFPFPFGGGQPALFPGDEPQEPPVEVPVVTDGGERCGLICQMFRHLQNQLQQVQEEVDEIRRKKQEQENEIDDDEGDDGEDDDGPYHNTTYTEQVSFIHIFC